MGGVGLPSWAVGRLLRACWGFTLPMASSPTQARSGGSGRGSLLHLRADLRGTWPGSARSVISNVIIFLFRSSSSSLALIDSFRYALSGFC